MDSRAIFTGISLFCFVLSGEALTLGNIRGHALIGQPLDVSIQVQLEAGEDSAATCFEAEIFHGEVRQEPRRARILVDAGAPSPAVNVRVLSSGIVDEPVVTVVLRALCGQKTSRRYVVLADLPRDVAASLSTPATAVPLAATLAVQSSPPAREKRVQKNREDPTTRTLPKSIQLAAKDPVARPAGQARLKLDTLDLFSDRMANLDSPMVFAPSEDALRNIQKIQTLESDVKALRATAAKTDASLASLKANLQAAESARSPGLLVYGLVVMLLFSLAGLAWLWNRQRQSPARDSRWWRNSVDAPLASNTQPFAAMPSAAPLPKDVINKPVEHADAPVGSLDVLTDFGPHHELDVNLMEMSEATSSHFLHPEAPPLSLVPVKEQALDFDLMFEAAPVAPPTPHVGFARSLNSEAVFDIRQQADFFVSLGQTEQAVVLLKQYISQSDEHNPSIYLDLLSIFHDLGLHLEFQQFREDFNLLFNGRTPDFASFKNEGSPLESYPDVLSKITVAWAKPHVLDVIEACIFRDPWDATKIQSFDLEAFRELLLLHAIAQATVMVPHSEARKFWLDSLPATLT